MTPEPSTAFLAQSVLAVYAGHADKSTKEVLVLQKHKVMTLCAAALGHVEPDLADFPELPDKVVNAYVVVLTYKGTSRFLRDLKWHLEAHGFLTVKQVEAVVGPPRPNDEDELRAYGIEVPATCWEAHEVVLKLHREARERAKQEVAKLSEE